MPAADRVRACRVEFHSGKATPHHLGCAFTGLIGTACGVILGCLFAIYIDPIFSFVNVMMGGGVWDPSIRGIYALPAELHLSDVLSAVALSLGLSFIVTIFPARRAARLNPVEALRYE